MNQQAYDTDVKPSSEPSPRRPHAPWLDRFLLLPGLLWITGLYLVPLALIAAMSFGTADEVGRPRYGCNPSNYLQVFDPVFFPILTRTLGYALLATGISLVLGYTLAFAIARHGGRFKTLILLIVLVPLFVDYLVRIYAMVQFFSDDGIMSNLLRLAGIGGDRDISMLRTTPVVIAGLVYNYLPLMILSTYVAIEQLDPSVLEASRDLYSNPSETLWRVTLPLTMPGIVGGCLLVFLATVGDFATAQLLGSPRNYMLGNLINGQLNGSGSLAIGAGLTVVLVALLASVAIGFTTWSRRRGAVAS